MVYRNRYDGIDPYAANLIRYKAYQLVGKAGFTQADRPDLEQELMLDLLKRMDKFNPAKAKKSTFIARVIEHHVSTILDARYARCRDWRMCSSLNEQMGSHDGETDEYIDQINTEGELGCNDANTTGWLAEELRLDVRRVVASLPADLQDLCARLCHSNIREISRETGIHHSKLYEDLYVIQDAFRRAKLKNRS